MGASLGAVTGHYNSTLTALVGRQGLHGKVERFSQLSSKVSKTMPKLEPLQKDIKQENLEMIVEPVAESDSESESVD